jgi:uncharacterized membrane protein
MAITIIALILFGLSLISLKLLVAFKLIDFAYKRWIAPPGDRRGGNRAEMILRERFASGEIDEAEMRRRLKVIAAD